jgi:XTP/dITP diphosphohydrolase
MKLVFATNNKHKLEEVSAILGSGFTLTTPPDCGITEDIPETQETLEGNALQKAHYIHDRTGLDCFADDTGLEVTALDGAPGVRSARYAADAGYGSKPDGSGTFDDNNRLLLKNLEGKSDRSARFRTVIALILDGREYLFDGRVEGRIIDEYRGEGGFGYDPVFVPEGSTETFAEMSAEQKNAGSHRARAVEKLAEFLKDKVN